MIAQEDPHPPPSLRRIGSVRQARSQRLAGGVRRSSTAQGPAHVTGDEGRRPRCNERTTHSMQSPVRALLVGVGTRGKHWARIMHDEPLCDTVGYMDVNRRPGGRPGAVPGRGRALHRSRGGAGRRRCRSGRARHAADGSPGAGEAGLRRKRPSPARRKATDPRFGRGDRDRPRAPRPRSTLTVGLNFRYLASTLAAKRSSAQGDRASRVSASSIYWTNRDGRRPGHQQVPTDDAPADALRAEHPPPRPVPLHLRRARSSASRLLPQPTLEHVRRRRHVFALLEMTDGTVVNYFGHLVGHRRKLRTLLLAHRLPQRRRLSSAICSATCAIVRPDSDQFETRSTCRRAGELRRRHPGHVAPCPGATHGGRGRAAPSGRDHLKTLALTVACEESSREHAVVHMAEFYERHGIPAEWL